MAELAKEKKKRTVAKTRVTKKEKFFVELDVENFDDLIELQLRKKDFDEAIQEFRLTQNAIIELVQEAEVETEANESLKMDDRVMIVDLKYEKCRKRLKDADIESDNESEATSGEYQSNVSGSRRNNERNYRSFKLPEIALPSFSGKYDEWLDFRRQFESLIKNDTRISESMKFLYLRSCLKGDAKSLQCPEEKFEALWTALVNTYENKRYIINKHIAELRNIKVMTRNSGTDLREIINSCKKHVRAFLSFDFEMNPLNEAFLIQIVAEKIDYVIRNDYELSLEPTALPDWNKFVTYLEKRCNTLEAIELSKKNKLDNAERKTYDKKTNVSKKPNSKIFNNFTENDNQKIKLKCYYCHKNHYMTRCEGFEKLKITERWAKVRELELCSNCLNKGHSKEECTRFRCPLCNGKHNKLLHTDSEKSEEPSTSSQDNVHKNKNNNTTVNSNQFVSVSTYKKQILLGTALIWVFDRFGKRHLARCLLDNGAMSNVISENLAQKLGLRREKVQVSVGVINDVKMTVDHKIRGTIESRFNPFKRSLDFLIVSNISKELPLHPVDTEALKIPQDISLADENFYQPGRIDLLLGMEVYHELFDRKGDFIKLNGGLLIAENTELGYVISGKTSENTSNTTINSLFCGLISNEELHQDMRRFWDFDSMNTIKSLTMEEKAVEDQYMKTHFRYEDGRYGVYLPLNADIEDLGDSKEGAITQFLNLEKRLDKDIELKNAYESFLNEYLELNHMELYSEDVTDVSSEDHYFLPHHAVIKLSSSTTQLRVVFNGSYQTKKKKSINSCSFNGANVQNDYINILIKFRFLRYVFSCDVSKMFRQVRVHSSQRRYQLILWRSNSSQPIKVYKLCTVTYGMKSAMFLSTRSVKQLSIDETGYPLASEAILVDLFVDDFLSGADSLTKIIELKRQMIELMKKGQFELHKWCSNVPGLLDDIDESKQEVKKEIADTKSVKALGNLWDTENDSFIFDVNKDILVEKDFNKRNVLSDVAKYYDPLGATEPMKLVAKIFMQHLWQKEYGWDDRLDENDIKFWMKYRDELKDLKPLKLERFLLKDSDVKDLQIHGFSDASSMGYGACIYVRAINDSGNVVIGLLCSKSRVAPLVSHTIPRLELMGANLLAHLMNTVRKSIPSFVTYREYFWSDSNIVLHWIRMMSRSLKTFVSHKVAEIQELTDVNSWRHVTTDQNPADLVSRGLMPSEMQDNDLWWKGPSYLLKPENEWPISKVKLNDVEIPEVKVQIYNIIEAKSCELIAKYSSYRKMIRITALIYRFYSNMKKKIDGLEVVRGRLTISELNAANIRLICVVQAEVYSKEVQDLKNKRELNRKSSLLTLSPFMDKSGLIRVGGRLSRAPISFNQKHPIILPHNHKFTEILIKSFHEDNLHSGTQHILSFIRTKYWITHGRSAVKKQVKSCVRCFKMKPKLISQYMGDLPEVRLQPSFPFQKSAVDYCGPFTLKANPRGTIKSKGYVSVFQCLATRAIHLELAGDMTSDCFLNCLYRFVGRRGEVSDLYSDNGTNFKGAHNKLNDLHRLFEAQEFNMELGNWCEVKQVNWHFIPATCPHMGGTWESAVKLTKTLLVKFLSDAYLSYEEFSTVLCRIESILNSRPITKLTDDETDLNALTPGHLIIGRPLNELIEPDIGELNIGRLSRFQYLTKLKQDFWKRWTQDYLHQLQMRYKWHDKVKVRVGQIVIVKEDNIPSFNWILGRITELHSGSDNITRVVTLRTKKGEMRRHLAKLCYLPIKDNESEE